MRRKLLASLVVLISCFSSGQGYRNPSNLSSQDQSFLKDAAQGGLAEVAMGRIAQSRGASVTVRKFGTRMVRDHSAANKQLMRVARRLHFSLPTRVSDEQRANMQDLRSLNGSAFDRKYGEMMRQDHETDVAAFKQENSAGTNRAVRNFAGRTLPTLNKHLEMAKRLPH
jgi:putative membrane protein